MIRLALGKLLSSQKAIAPLLMVLSLIAAPRSANAEDEETPVGYPSLEYVHDALQESVRAAARVIDSFFSDEEYEQERNDSSLRLRFDVALDEDDDTAFRFRPKLRLRLPGTKRTFLLQVQGASEAVDAESGIERTDLFKGAVEDDPLEMSLSLYESRGRFLLTPEVGVGVEDQDPTAFAGGRVRYQWYSSGKDLSLLASERLRAYTNRGLESISLLRADTFVWKDVLWRNDAQLNWREDEEGIRYGPASALYVPLDNRSALAFEGGFSLVTEPNHELDQIDVAIRYRRRVLTDWSVVEVAPGISFENENDFKASGSLLLRLELEF